MRDKPRVTIVRPAKNDSEHSFSGVAPPNTVTVNAVPDKPVLYDANGKALVRPIGFSRNVR